MCEHLLNKVPKGLEGNRGLLYIADNFCVWMRGADSKSCQTEQKISDYTPVHLQFKSPERPIIRVDGSMASGCVQSCRPGARVAKTRLNSYEW